MIVANGTLPTSKGILFTVENGLGFDVRMLSLVNAGTSLVVVNIYHITEAGTSKLISPKNLMLNAGDRAEFNDEIILQNGDSIEGEVNAGTTTEWQLSALDKTNRSLEI